MTVLRRSKISQELKTNLTQHTYRETLVEIPWRNYHGVIFLQSILKIILVKYYSWTPNIRILRSHLRRAHLGFFWIELTSNRKCNIKVKVGSHFFNNICQEISWMRCHPQQHGYSVSSWSFLSWVKVWWLIHMLVFYWLFIIYRGAILDSKL